MKRPSTRMGLIFAGVLIAVVALATTAAARTSAPAEEALARAREAFERCWSMHLTPQGVEETT